MIAGNKKGPAGLMPGMKPVCSAPQTASAKGKTPGSWPGCVCVCVCCHSHPGATWGWLAAAGWPTVLVEKSGSF